jgi:ribosomal protein L1
MSDELMKTLFGCQYFCDVAGTLGSDIISMVTMFAKGVEYVSTKDPGVNLFGSLKFTIGRLDMTNDQIDANMTTFMKSLTAHRPLDFGSVSRLLFSSGKTLFI